MTITHAQMTAVLCLLNSLGLTGLYPVSWSSYRRGSMVADCGQYGQYVVADTGYLRTAHPFELGRPDVSTDQ